MKREHSVLIEYSDGDSKRIGNLSLDEATDEAERIFNRNSIIPVTKVSVLKPDGEIYIEFEN